MKFLCSEKISQHKYKTPEGYLVCVDSVLARTGKQDYKRCEAFGDACDDPDKVIAIDRKPEEVFSDKTLASFENKPITVEHPNEDVNINNHSDYAVGFARDIKRGKNEDGEDVMLGTLVITDKQTIEEIENGEHTDLSCGYDCDIVDEANPQQKNIRGNHIALCQHGRAGNAHIVDTAVKDGYLSEDEKELCDYMLRNAYEKGMSSETLLKKMRSYYSMYQRVAYQKPDDVLDYFDEKIATGMYDSGLQVRQVNQGYAIVVGRYWRQYKEGAFVDRTADSIDEARRIKQSLEKADKMDFVIIDCTNALKKKVVDSTNDDFDQQYAKESRDLQNDVKRANDIWRSSKNKTARQIFTSFGYKEDGEDTFFKQNGNYTKVVVFNDFDDIKYYVLKDGKIPAGWTLTRTKWYDSITDVEPHKGESKEDFISRFMSETKSEYPDEKQRLAVAYSYWKKAKGEDSMKDATPKFKVGETVKYHAGGFNGWNKATLKKVYTGKYGGIVYDLRTQWGFEETHIPEEYLEKINDSMKDSWFAYKYGLTVNQMDQFAKQFNCEHDKWHKSFSGKHEDLQKLKDLLFDRGVAVGQINDSMKDKEPLHIVKTHPLTENYIALEDDKHHLWVVRKSMYHNEKEYFGGGILEFDLSKAKESAKRYETMDRLEKKYGKVEGYKRYMAGKTDSVKDSKISDILKIAKIASKLK